jgi:poly(A) polymerase
MGPHLEDMLLLAEADQKAQSADAHPDIPVRHLRQRINSLRESDGIHLEPPLDGNEIMSILGIRQGPLVGKAKDWLIEEASARNSRMSRQEAVAVLKDWAKRREIG